MQRVLGEMASEGLAFAIHGLGVNGAANASGNAAFLPGITLPWLQDEDTVDAWGSWGATLRDVVFLDAENRITDVTNLTADPLGGAENEAAFKALVRAAGAP